MKCGFFSLLIILLLASGTSFSQTSSLFGSTSQGDKRDKAVPTEITSETMDIQTAQNIAVFTGNVKVKDQDIAITCDKMTIFLEDKKSGGITAVPDDKTSKGGKKISKILCEGNVVIIRKYKDGDENKEQQAQAGQAEYDLKEQKIILSDNPILFQGSDKLAGDTITMFRDSERVIIKGGKIDNPAKLLVSPETLESSPEPQ